MSDGPSRADRLEQTLAGLLDQSPELEAAAVVSFDGLPMASALPPGMEEDRVAAMSAALLSLGERAAEGLGRGELSQVYIEGRNGTVFLVSAENEAVLVAVAPARAKVGLVLFELRRAAAAVAEVLRSSVEPAPAPVPVPFAEPAYVPPPAPSDVLPPVGEIAEAPAAHVLDFPAAPAHAAPTFAEPLPATPVYSEPVVPAQPYAPTASTWQYDGVDPAGTPPTQWS